MSGGGTERIPVLQHELLVPVSEWRCSAEYRLFAKHCYDFADIISGTETQRLIDSSLASCDVSNAKEAIRTIANLATTIQLITSHVSKVTNCVTKNKARYSRGQLRGFLDEVNEMCNFQHQFKKMHALMMNYTGESNSFLPFFGIECTIVHSFQ